MKKILSLLLTAAMTFSLLTGCSGGGVTVDVGDFVLDEAAELTVAKQATEENKEEGCKIESYDISIGDLDAAVENFRWGQTVEGKHEEARKALAHKTTDLVRKALEEKKEEKAALPTV